MYSVISITYSYSCLSSNQIFLQENMTRSVCGSGSDATLHSSISTSFCSLSLDKVSREDHGHWMCLLNDITEFDTVCQSNDVPQWSQNIIITE